VAVGKGGAEVARETGWWTDRTRRSESSPVETIKATRCGKKNQGKTTTFVTTVPGFDGYQWRKYGQKQIEAAQYSR
jgi:hypothetical protein